MIRQVNEDDKPHYVWSAELYSSDTLLLDVPESSKMSIQGENLTDKSRYDSYRR